MTLDTEARLEGHFTRSKRWTDQHKEKNPFVSHTCLHFTHSRALVSALFAHFIKYASDMSHLLGTDGKLSHNALPFSQQISLETVSTTNPEIHPGYQLRPCCLFLFLNQPTLLLKCMFKWCYYTGVCFECVFLEFLILMDNFMFYF